MESFIEIEIMQRITGTDIGRWIYLM